MLNQIEATPGKPAACWSRVPRVVFAFSSAQPDRLLLLEIDDARENRERRHRTLDALQVLVEESEGWAMERK